MDIDNRFQDRHLIAKPKAPIHPFSNSYKFNHFLAAAKYQLGIGSMPLDNSPPISLETPVNPALQGADEIPFNLQLEVPPTPVNTPVPIPLEAMGEGPLPPILEDIPFIPFP